MSDVLIRNVPDEVLASLDARAKKLGLSRSAYLRRELTRSATTDEAPVTTADLERFAETVADLDDPEVMRRAWQ